MIHKSAVPFLGLLLAVATAGGDGPKYTNSGELIFPQNYREWVWLSAGIGMSYSAEAQANPNPEFDNVFVSPEAYRAFMTSGNWPDGTVFVLENRSSLSKGSINQGGRYQGKLDGVEAHVKDKGKWAFYGFRNEQKPARMIPLTASCYSCHEQHGAVDTTFVQFYPTLFAVAEQKKTIKAGWTAEGN